MGDTNALCYASGHKAKFSELHRQYDGQWVRSEYFNIRHPQDFAPHIDPESVETRAKPVPVVESLEDTVTVI